MSTTIVNININGISCIPVHFHDWSLVFYTSSSNLSSISKVAFENSILRLRIQIHARYTVDTPKAFVSNHTKHNIVTSRRQTEQKPYKADWLNLSSQSFAVLSLLSWLCCYKKLVPFDGFVVFCSLNYLSNWKELSRFLTGTMFISIQ